MIFLGATSFNLENLPVLNPSDANPFVILATVTTLVMWSFVGIETATVPADNYINPKETIPNTTIYMNIFGKIVLRKTDAASGFKVLKTEGATTEDWKRIIPEIIPEQML